MSANYTVNVVKENAQGEGAVAPVAPQPQLAPVAPVVEQAAPPAAAKGVTDGLYINGMVFPPYPMQGQNVTLTGAQYTTLISMAHTEGTAATEIYSTMMGLLPIIIIVVVWMMFMKPQRKATQDVMEHLSAKTSVEAMRGDVKVLLEKQNQVLDLLKRPA